MGIRKIIFGLLVLALALPALAQTETQEFDDDQITFSYDSTLATGIETETQENIPMVDEVPYWGATPAYTSYIFADYPGLDEFFMLPVISIYSTTDFADFTVAASGDVDAYGLGTELDALLALLEDEPDLSEFAETADTNGQVSLPLIPLFNAAQVLRIQPEYIEFQNGRGIRYVTYYSQAVDVITDLQLFYTFQGVTDDGETYISAIFPVKSGILPEEVDYSTLDYDALAENYMPYLDETLASLNNQDEESYSPSLESLDSVIESLEVK